MANSKIIERKKEVVNEIASKVKESSSVILFEYRGLSVSEMTELRKNLRNNDSDVKVYKNTLADRALASCNYDLKEHFNGPKAMAFSSDAIAPLKVLYDFAKKHPALEIKAGIIDGDITEIDTLTKLATLPSRQELLTMLASGLMGTVRDLSIGLNLYSENLEK